MRETLSATFPHFALIGHHGRCAAERFAFASKLSMSDVKFTPPDAGLFGFCSVTVIIGDVPVHIINVHLTPVVLERGERIVAAMTALSETETKHESKCTHSN